MKNIYCAVFIMVAFRLFSQEGRVGEWFKHWHAGLSFTQEKNYYAAIDEYSQAINLLQLVDQNFCDHLYLYNDRGQAYLLVKKYGDAILDFTQVIETKETPISQFIRALWGRATCYAALGDEEGFKQDYERLRITDPDYPKVEYTKEFIIFRNFNGAALSTRARDKFCCSMIHLDFCKSKEDIMFTSNGVCLVKRRCQCGCEKSIQEYAYEQRHGKSCNCCGEKIKLDFMGVANQSKSEKDCKYWCDRVAQASFVLCGTTFKLAPCRLMCTGVVEAIREGCHCCCEGEGFYKRCVKPFENYISQVPCDPQFD